MISFGILQRVGKSTTSL